MATQGISSTEQTLPTAPPVDSLPRKGRSYWGSSLLLGLVCLIVVGVHVGGLSSLMRFVAEREAWIAEKRQVEQRRGEWRSLVQAYQTDVAEYKADAVKLTTKLADLEEQRTQLAEEVATLAGQQDALRNSRDAALALERRAKQDEQTARDTEQAAKAEVAGLTKQKSSLENLIRNLQASKDQLSASVTSAQGIYKRQTEQLTAQNTTLKSLDNRVIELRAELRTRNDELVTLSEDVSKLQQDKQRATDGLTDLAAQKKTIEVLRSEKATLEGEIAALTESMAKAKTQTAVEQRRLVQARKLLAPYYLDIRKRALVKKELSDLEAEREKNLELTKTAKSALDEIEADVAGQRKMLEDVNKRVESLRSEEARIVAKILQMSQAVKGQGGSSGSTDEKSNGE